MKRKNLPPNQRVRSIGQALIFSAILVLTSLNVYAQGNVITGQVQDMNDNTLPGVNVQVKGTTRGAVTGLEGDYRIQAQPTDTLVFSYIGFNREEVPVGNRSVIDVVLAEDVETLQEVVVVGYGTQRKSDLTGSVSSVTGEEVNNLASQDVTQNLQGRVAGLQVTSNSGNPAEGPTIRVRGMGTINNADPLYVVDGFQTNDISWLTSNDIQSIEVLKDASATAIYGSRGANGVVLITTKDGSASTDRFNVEFNAYGGVQEASNTVDVMNAHEYVGYRAQAELNALRSANPDGEYDIYDGIRGFAGADSAIARHVYDNQLEGTDWQDVVLRRAPVQVYNLSISGSTDKHNYVLGGTYQDTEGIVENSYLDKMTLRFRNDYHLTDWVSVGTNVNFVRDEFTRLAEDAFGGLLPSTIRVSPLAPVFDPNTGNFGSPNLSDVRENPAQRLEEYGMDLQSRYKYVLGGYTQFDITEDLNFRSQAFFDYGQTRISQYLPQYFVNVLATRPRSQLTEGFQENTSWMSSNYFNYSKTFSVHSINAMAGFEFQSSESVLNNITVYDVPQAEELRFINMQRGGDFTPATSISRLALQSYFGRVNYAYDQRYAVTATLRYDGSSRFARGNRWGVFPSFAAAWNVDQEGFFENIGIISSLKARAGWGQVGNESSAAAHGTVTYAQPLQNYSFGGLVVNGKSPRVLGNDDLQWETSESINVGIDAGFFNEKLSLTADYFIRTTKDMIVAAPAPIYAGALPPRENAGSIENRGFEFNINYRNNQGAVNFEVGGNMSFTRNEVLSLGSGEFLLGDNFSHIGVLTRTQVGQPVSSFYGVRTDGIFRTEAQLEEATWQPNAELGDVRFVNQNDDDEITMAGDAVFLGNPFPDYIFGFTAKAEYAGFDVSVLINGSQGNEVVNNLSRYINNSGDWRDNSLRSRLDFYSPDNTDTDEPRVIASDPNNNAGIFSDRYVEDASFIRLRNVQLGYTLPESLLEPIGIDMLRVYIAADNLLTITDYSGYDPEIGQFYGNPLNYGVAGANYPKARTIFAGINLKF